MDETASQLEARRIKEALAASRARLLASIAGVSEEHFKRRPASPSAGEAAEPDWSIAEVLAHLLWYERTEAERIALALEQNGAPVTPRSDEEHAASAKAGRIAPVPQLIHGLLAARRQIERLVDASASIEDGFERSVSHPLRGRESVGWILREKVAAHEAEHVAQIEAVKRGMGHTA